LGLEVKSLMPELYRHYNDFLLSHQGALFYYSAKYKDFLVDLLQCQQDYLLAVDGEDIVGVLPLMAIEGKFGRVYNSLPFYGSNGGIITGRADAFEALINEYNNRIYEGNVASATIIANPLIEQDYSRLKYDLTDERIGQFTSLELNHPEEEILVRIDPTARRNVKKALKSGVKIEIDNNQIDFLRRVHQESMISIGGRAKSDTFFSLIEKHFVPGEDYNIYLAKMDSKPIAALFLFYFNRTVEYWIPVTVHDYRTYQPMALIILQAMVDACQNGFRLWNWGGTWLTQDGVYRFKKKWETMEKRYTYYIKINNQELYHSSEEALLEEYGNFYVIPFGALRKTGGENE
jgi:hypothetical protein